MRIPFNDTDIETARKSRNLEILNKLSSGNQSGWVEDARRREKYELWYDIKFYVVLKWLMFKRYFKR